MQLRKFPNKYKALDHSTNTKPSVIRVVLKQIENEATSAIPHSV